jgi:hypothetical protein
MRPVRAVLVAILIHGLAPGFAEAAEAVVHYASTGHLAHSPGEEDLGDQGPEHSCGVVFHQCGCCVAMTVMPNEATEVGHSLAMVSEGGPTPPSRTANRSLDPPFRPPIR